MILHWLLLQVGIFISLIQLGKIPDSFKFHSHLRGFPLCFVDLIRVLRKPQKTGFAVTSILLPSEHIYYFFYEVLIAI